MITLRPMTEDDFARFWPTYRAVVAAQETYALDPAPTFDAARALWLDAPLCTCATADTWLARPRAYRHARFGFVDCLVMFKWLGGDAQA
ncbi:hypothetical protein KTE25_21520 [Burkholderia multivorans]|nr:hypothetical protein [Burkholderia multivorans]MBU9396154.1 hypothetical protein [Burkholderia multivorans]